VNKDLADVLGNFVSLVTKFAAARLGPAVPAGDYGPAEAAVTAEIAARLATYAAHMDAMEMRKAAQELRAIWVAGNEYLQAAAPWAAIKTDPERAGAITRFAFNLIRLYAAISRPFLPDACDAMLAALRLDGAGWPEDVAAALDALPAGHGFDVPPVLFAKIDDTCRADLEARFAGTG
jgi:methionyl-tRNA synthetase